MNNETAAAGLKNVGISASNLSLSVDWHMEKDMRHDALSFALGATTASDQVELLATRYLAFLKTGVFDMVAPVNKPE